MANYVPLNEDECPWKLATDIEDYGSKEQLWDEIKTYLQHHVFLPDERLYDILAAWVLASWIPEKWKVIPYLLVRGPVSSGKTRLLETLEAIAYRGIFSANMTSAALFRVLELHKPTIFLDETEIYNKEEHSDVVHLLNAGYRRGQRAWRVERDRDGLPYVKGYDVFGFKGMAGTQELAQTLNSRGIIIDMVKNVNRVNFSVNEKISQALRNRLLLWRFHQLSTLCEHCEDSEDAEGTYLELAGLKDGRLMELFYCLMKVSNAGTESIISYAQDMQKTRESEEQTSLEYTCLDAMLKCKQDIIDGKLLARTIKDKINEGLDEKEKFRTRFIMKLLSGLGFKKTHMRQGNGIIINERMLAYRLQQYKIKAEEYVLPESSLSSQSSQHGSLMEFAREDKVMVNEESSPTSSHEEIYTCWLCLKPIPEDLADVTTLDGKFVHIPCFHKLEDGRRNREGAL